MRRRVPAGFGQVPPLLFTPLLQPHGWPGWTPVGSLDAGSGSVLKIYPAPLRAISCRPPSGTVARNRRPRGPGPAIPHNGRWSNPSARGSPTCRTPARGCAVLRRYLSVAGARWKSTAWPRDRRSASKRGKTTCRTWCSRSTRRPRPNSGGRPSDWHGVRRCDPGLIALCFASNSRPSRHGPACPDRLPPQVLVQVARTSRTMARKRRRHALILRRVGMRQSHRRGARGHSSPSREDELPRRGFLGDIRHHLDQRRRILRQGFRQRTAQSARVGDPPGADAERLRVSLEIRIAQG